MAFARILKACKWGIAASIALPAVALAQSHPEFVPLGRVSAALYRPDSGPAPHIAFLVSHRTANNLNNIGMQGARQTWIPRPVLEHTFPEQ